MVNEFEIKKQICDIGRRIYARNMVAANDGNISVKLNDNEFLCTPTGVSKGFMTPEFICKVDAQESRGLGDVYKRQDTAAVHRILRIPSSCMQRSDLCSM